MLNSFQANRNKLAALEVQIAIEQDLITLSAVRYRTALSDFLGVIDAQRNLNAARQTKAEAKDNVAGAEVGIYLSSVGSEIVQQSHCTAISSEVSFKLRNQLPVVNLEWDMVVSTIATPSICKRPSASRLRNIRFDLFGRMIAEGTCGVVTT